ncbi:TetR/AcrR family transcriptional regulator [Mangrovimicrobium sediminis]|uniref:TetR/AcrR family transcriptional regulator n=1 Tax=Mangrovimicrobium sediminis TaxID=2562682 RepID=A0A4Z0LVD0_9GAMM|nr:TetR/AcrR family transcriptional regulator [Haliea sp. SAOS-164]TGD71282.1 TetR/AcrR family transcriptional regulator [Haliea sp. SAOS-164]
MNAKAAQAKAKDVPQDAPKDVAKGAKAPAVDRRTSGVQRQGRAAKVVSSVLRTTAEELNRVGYANLRVDEVAERAGVNKTTIYRRWPNKAILVSETLDAHFQDERPLPETGSLRSDIIDYLRMMVTMTQRPTWRGVMTTLLSRTDPEVEAVAHKLYLRERQFRTRLVQRAIDRGELPRTADAELIGDMFSAPILRRLLTFREDVRDEFILSVVDVTLAGAAVVAMRND